MPTEPQSDLSAPAEQLAALRLALAPPPPARAPVLPLGVDAFDARLADRELDGAGLHEIAGASASLGDDAAATLFLAGIAARFAARPGATVPDGAPV